jgi:hypothetical protein
MKVESDDHVDIAHMNDYALPRDCIESALNVKIAPRSPIVAVDNCAFAALHGLNPARRRIAKSAISCGISCSRMAAVVRKPIREEMMKLPATANP